MRREDKALYLVSALAVGVLMALPSEAQTIGVHAYTWHDSNDKHDSTPGLYVSLPSGPVSLVAGAYQNSIRLPNGDRRTSFYAGAEKRWGQFGVAVVAVSGYKAERIPMKCEGRMRHYSRCWDDVGNTSHEWSVTLAPFAIVPLGPVAARVVLAGPGAVHFAIERRL